MFSAGSLQQAFDDGKVFPFWVLDWAIHLELQQQFRECPGDGVGDPADDRVVLEEADAHLEIKVVVRDGVGALSCDGEDVAGDVYLRGVEDAIGTQERPSMANSLIAAVAVCLWLVGYVT